MVYTLNRKIKYVFECKSQQKYYNKKILFAK